MFFVAVVLVSGGYTLLYAAVKGDSYKVDGVPVWRRPWLPYVDIFSGRALTGGQGPQTDSTAAPGSALLAAFTAGASAATPGTSQPAPAPTPANPPSQGSAPAGGSSSGGMWT